MALPEWRSTHLGSLSEHFRSLCSISRHACTALIGTAQSTQCIGEAELCGALVPLGGVVAVPLYANATL